MSAHCPPQPLNQKLLTPGAWVLLALTGVGLCFAGWRFAFGIGSVTNLDQQHPWGIWIAIDVATGVALAAGGFTTAALAHIFHREHYHAIVRPALLTAMLGYTFVGMGLLVDLGRFYNIWHPALPSMWSGHSVLFEVGMCVMCYLTVLYIEFLPIVCERLLAEDRWPRLRRLSGWLHGKLERIMFLFVIAGVVLSCLHQSSLGNLMVLAPSKMHDLWDTPILSLLFLLSAISVGFPMVIFESLCASRAFGLKPEMHVLSPLSRFIPVVLGIYLAFKVGDLAVRDKLSLLSEGSPQATMWVIEVFFGVAVPFAILLMARVRNSPTGLFAAAALVVFGVALNRINVFLVAFQPLYPQKTYFPSIGEIAVTTGLIALLIFCYRVLVNYFPVISHPVPERTAGKTAGDGALRRAKAKPNVLVQILPLAVGLAWCATATAQTADDAKKAMEQLGSDCKACHVCDTPTVADPCLPHCTRSSTVTISEQFKHKHGPTVVILDELEDRYLPVPFDHKGHAEMANMTRGCAVCHHYTPEGLAHPACKSCHELDPAAVDMRKPSLKGAYHRQCMSCHREWSGNTECGVCHHPKTGVAREAGEAVIIPSKDDLIGRMHPPIPEPDRKIYKTRIEGKPPTEVLFRHKEHIQRYGLTCAECHREDGCARCHQENAAAQVRPRTLADHHRPCSVCHTNVSPAEDGARHCDACHYESRSGPPRPFEHTITDLPLMKYHRHNACRECHVTIPFGKLSPECGSCHDSWTQANFRHDITGQALDETHRGHDCTDCHAERNYTAPPTCNECHESEGEDAVIFPTKRPGPLVR